MNWEDTDDEKVAEIELSEQEANEWDKILIQQRNEIIASMEDNVLAALTIIIITLMTKL